MQTEEIIIWIKAISKAVVQTFWQYHKREEVHTKPLWPMCYNKLPGGEYIYLLLYVDDMLIVGPEALYLSFDDD